MRGNYGKQGALPLANPALPGARAYVSLRVSLCTRTERSLLRNSRVRERSAAAGGRGGRSEAVGRRPPAERSRPSDRQRSAAGAPCYFEANSLRSLARGETRRLTHTPGSRQGGVCKGQRPLLPVISLSLATSALFLFLNRFLIASDLR